MTQGKIERWHQTLKNRILLENYYLPGDLKAQIDAFVGALQSGRAITKDRQSHPGRRLLWTRPDHPFANEKGSNAGTIANRRLQHHIQAA